MFPSGDMQDGAMYGSNIQLYALVLLAAFNCNHFNWFKQHLLSEHVTKDVFSQMTYMTKCASWSFKILKKIIVYQILNVSTLDRYGCTTINYVFLV